MSLSLKLVKVLRKAILAFHQNLTTAVYNTCTIKDAFFTLNANLLLYLILFVKAEFLIIT